MESVRSHSDGRQRPSPWPFPPNGEPMTFAEYKKHFSSARKDIYDRRGPLRRLMREQMLRCQDSREVMRVFVIAMQYPDSARHIAVLHNEIVRALYASRTNVTDQRILDTITCIILRLRRADMEAPLTLLNVGLKFAARSRSLPGMKRYLKMFRDRGLPISRDVLRSTFAKIGIGNRGLGEIRNGRWARDKLMQVLLGFDDVPPEEAYHLETFLPRDDWHVVHGWMTVLSKCKATDRLWHEWELWLQHSSRAHPRQLQARGSCWTTRSRGDYWHVELMCRAGDMQRAWAMYEKTDLAFHELSAFAQSMLLDGPKHATLLHSDVSGALLP